jgi:dephospho-CoA kinase
MQDDDECAALFAPAFQVPEGFDYALSTEENYEASGDDRSFVGEYAGVRETLDYSYHKVYQRERQLLQDGIISSFLQTSVSDSKSDMTCPAPINNWIVFTAGAMGAGKSHAMRWMDSAEVFPLDAFVSVDPDEFRCMLPETDTYINKNRSTWGFHTQKEVNCISEILTLVALKQGKNVIVDGTLRDHKWHETYFQRLRERFPEIKIGIIHVIADEKIIFERAEKRAMETDREIPIEWLQEIVHGLPKSVKLLSPHADFSATIENNESPTLVGPENLTWEEFRETFEKDMPCPID